MAHPQHTAPAITPDGEITVVDRAPFRERLSWALYDFSNTIFSMNVVTLYASVWLIHDLGASSTLYASASAIASVMVIAAIPVLGAVSDARRRRKPWVIGFTVLSCVATAAIGVFGVKTLPLVGAGVSGGGPEGSVHLGGGALFWVMAAYILANFAYQAAQPFYNAMMPELVPVSEQGRLSGFGTALGYVGSIVGVLLVMPFFTGGLPGIHFSAGTMSLLHTLFPFTSTGGRVATFVPTALLFFLFSVPFVLFCRDHFPVRDGGAIPWKESFREVGHTIRDAKKHPGLLRFILTSFLYQDAIGTIVGFMTVYAVEAVGFTKGTEITLFLVLTVPAIIGSYIAGVLVDRIGARRTLSITLVGWVVFLALMISLPGKTGFWIAGLLIGLVFGGVPAAERPVLLNLIPDVEAGRYFSLMLLSSRAAAIAGPLIWALTVDGLTSSFGKAIAYRCAVSVIALMFVAAAWLLRKVPDHRPLHAA